MPDERIKKYIALAEAFLKNGHTEQAISEYKKALEISPEDVEIICKIGSAYFNCGEIDKAIEEYQKANVLQPDNSEVHNFLGTAYYEKGMIHKAEEEYKKAIRLQSDNAGVYNNLGIIYSEQNMLDEALELHKKAVELSPSDSVFRSNLGVILSQMGLKKEAENEFLKALKLNPNEITAHYCLGMEIQHKGTLEVGQILKIGTLLKIQPALNMKLKDYRRVYSTKIEEVEEDTIVISAPTHKGVVIPFRPGQQLIAGVSKEDALYGFYTNVTERGKINDMPVLRIKKGKHSKRIQRRKYVRIDGISQVDLKILKRSGGGDEVIYFDKRKVREKNISGGGMLILSPTILAMGTILEISVSLPHFGMIRTVGEVVRVQKVEDEYEIGISFINLSEKDREKIIKYVYQRQVELRRLGF